MQPSTIRADSSDYERIPVRTRLILRGDSLAGTIEEGMKQAGVSTKPDDVLVVSEKAVGASQGRYYLLDEDQIRPGPLARFLSKFVTRTPAGIGLGMPETMHCALEECGTARILLAAVVGAVGKLFGRKGDFYRIAGPKARSIDGPTTGTIPPFNRAVSLAPLDPQGVARRLAERFSCGAAVVDVNDLGANLLAIYPADLDADLLLSLLSDNPLGQGIQQTPVGIVRPISP
ncbi:F420-0--gamma-glutamyl ligase [Candidatus Fermentibacteria bacterium]|nr:F420-0--gamma-glutamyl ligase [Candidatus Fermentibacteria bacterium]